MSIDRREFFSWVSNGLGGAALSSLLAADGTAIAAPLPGDATDPPPHHPPRAKRAIHICLCGALSHLDSFDYKPALARYHGKPMPASERPDVFFGQVGLLRKNDWEFQTARQKRSLGLGTFSGDRGGCRRADRHPVDVRRNVEPHAGDVSGKLRIPVERIPGARLLAVLRPGIGMRQPPVVCRYSRCPRLPRGRYHQLDQWLSPRPPPGSCFSQPGTGDRQLDPAESISDERRASHCALLVAMNEQHLRSTRSNDVANDADSEL